MSSQLAVSTGKKSQRSNSMEKRAKEFVDEGGLGNRKTDTAFVKPVPGTSKVWHKSDSDQKEHLTIEYSNQGQHVTTKHVYRT